MLPAPESAAGPGLPVGAPAPRFQLADLDGRPVSFDDVLTMGTPTALLFVHPRCGPCEALMPQIARWQRAAAGLLTMPIISEGTVEENHAKAAQHGLTMLLLQRASEVAQAYGAYGTPSAVLVDAGGAIASPVVSGADAIRALIESTLDASPASPLAWDESPAPWPSRNGHAATSHTSVARPLPGDAAPDFALPSLNGAILGLTDLRGVETLLLFWNAACGFCQRMIEPLKAWETSDAAATRRLVIIARGDASATGAAGFRSTVLADPEGSLSQTFGANGTPMAVLLDPRGQVASEIAVGAEAVLELANRASVTVPDAVSGPSTVKPNHAP
jgi:peroxiredoxin